MKQLSFFKTVKEESFQNEKLNVEQMLRIRGGDDHGGQQDPGEPWNN
jgi:hypothetical protein